MEQWKNVKKNTGGRRQESDRAVHGAAYSAEAASAAKAGRNTVQGKAEDH
jgi:hypothetical protein